MRRIVLPSLVGYDGLSADQIAIEKPDVFLNSKQVFLSANYRREFVSRG